MSSLLQFQHCRLSVLNKVFIKCKNLKKTTQTFVQCRRMACLPGVNHQVLSCHPQVDSLHSCSTRLYLRHFSTGKKKSDPKLINRMLNLTYLSFAIGGCLLLVFLKGEYDKMRRRLFGIEIATLEHYKKKFSCCKYKDFLLPSFCMKSVLGFREFQVRGDDVWIAGFPKSGITWLEEIVYLISSDLDFDKATTVGLETRIPYFEYVSPGLDTIGEMKSPRLLKTHLPLKLLPHGVKECQSKVIYIARNPKDVAVSLYHFVRALTESSYSGKFQDFHGQFLNDKVTYGPYWQHVKEFWEHRDDDNILFIKYEDLQKDPANVMKSIAIFLGKNLTDSQIAMIVDHCSFNKMKDNSMVNYKYFDDLGLRHKHEAEFMRKGKVGDWQNYFSEKMNFDFDRKTYLKWNDTGLVFDYVADSRTADSTTLPMK